MIMNTWPEVKVYSLSWSTDIDGKNYLSGTIIFLLNIIQICCYRIIVINKCIIITKCLKGNIFCFSQLTIIQLGRTLLHMQQPNVKLNVNAH